MSEPGLELWPFVCLASALSEYLGHNSSLHLFKHLLDARYWDECYFSLTLQLIEVLRNPAAGVASSVVCVEKLGDGDGDTQPEYQQYRLFIIKTS